MSPVIIPAEVEDIDYCMDEDNDDSESIPTPQSIIDQLGFDPLDITEEDLTSNKE